VGFCKKLLSVPRSGSAGSSACKVSRGSKRVTVLYLVGKYCFVIIQVAWDRLVISCWVWQLGNLKFVVWALNIKRNLKKNMNERGMVNISGECYKDNI
jgi:hypothetical protein